MLQDGIQSRESYTQVTKELWQKLGVKGATGLAVVPGGRQGDSSLELKADRTTYST